MCIITFIFDKYLFFPFSFFSPLRSYWPAIDDALRRVTIVKRLQVRVLASYWNHTKPSMMSFLRSLNALNSDLFDIEVVSALFLQKCCYNFISYIFSSLSINYNFSFLSFKNKLIFNALIISFKFILKMYIIIQIQLT